MNIPANQPCSMPDSLQREFLPADYLVCNIGDSGDAAYVIEAGAVEVLAKGGQRVAILKTGEIFGEVALLDQLPRTAAVRTLEPTTLLRIERDHVRELLKRADPVIRHLLELLLERFRFRSGYLETFVEGSERDPQSDSEAAMLTLVLARDLTHALESGQLELAYQPLVSLSRHSLVGFEALIRWQHPLLGSIMPTKLIGLAEKTGLIRPLGLWVLQRAIRDWPVLRDYCQVPSDIPIFVSVNLSGAELSNPVIVETIADYFSVAHMSPRELKVELTETAIIEDLESVGAALRKLSAMGVTIALDDFGTGYSSFDYLKMLPISCIKIDKSFIQDAKGSPRSREIVHTSLQLARSLGLMTIAEGIEDESTSALLADLGCDIAQGYFYSLPMSLQDIPNWLYESRTLGRLTS
jgi:EAL domain-containing protein (putative c-di-GMP-specific phosphodiesterase class I)